MKQGWAFAWRSLMAGELLVISRRCRRGASSRLCRNLADAPALLATMIVILVIGIVVDLVFFRDLIANAEALGAVVKASRLRLPVGVSPSVHRDVGIGIVGQIDHCARSNITVDEIGQ